MNKWVWLVLLPLCANASTFVGNGGGAGDVELAVTKKQIEEGMTAVKKHPDALFCKCNSVYEDRSVCEPLRALNEEQRKYCSSALSNQAGELLRLVTNPNAVSIRWTDEPIRVADRGDVRAVDAVTDPGKREVTINLKRFLEMKQFERVFLLTHELLHLTELDGKRLNDEGAVGPFDGDEGGRRLLNAMGSAAAVLPGTYPYDVKKYRARLLRSQSWKPFWIDMNGGQARFATKPAGTFATDDFGRFQMTARYALGNWVFAIGYRSENSDKRVLDTVDVEEKKDIFSFGLGYRFFFFGDPETFWGQSHLLVQGLVDSVNAKLKLSDTTGGPEFNDEVKVWGGNLSANYYLPVFWGFWGYVGSAYEVHPYKYKNVNLEYKKNLLSTYLGVAYAF